MTISSTTRTAGPFAGAGNTATYPFAFKVFDDTDLYVATLNTATGVIAQLVLTTDYTATLNADQDGTPGGSITLTAGNLAVGYSLVITSDMAALQGLDLANAGGFYPDVINAALDTLTILIQQLATQLARTVQAPLVDESPAVSLPAASDRAGKVLTFDANGNLLLLDPAPGGTVPGPQEPVGVVDGKNTSFQFVAGVDAPLPLVFVGGIFQTPGVDYDSPIASLGGTLWQLNFTVAPAQGPVTVLLLA